MKKPEQYFKALVTSVVIAVLVYMSLGVLGAMSYNRAPGGIDPLVINNIPSSNIIYYICCIGICFVAYFSYPVAVFPGILALESGIKECKYEEGV
jgi:singapore isolate B (sub-type 7) whole genome shotgun sequence assembly, scaffold_1